MAVVLHFGVHKTGSSSIQNALANHNLSDGWKYIHFGQPNSSLITRAAYSIGRNTSNSPELRHLIAAGDGEEVRRRKIRDYIQSELSRFSSSKNCIYSAEAIVMLNQAELSRLQKDLGRIGSDVRAVAYIRDPASFFTSAYQQTLKRKFISLEEHNLKLRYSKRLMKFHTVFGSQKTQLWRFEPSRFLEEDIVLDFCDRVGCKMENYRSVRSNERVSSDAFKLLYIYRRKYNKWARPDSDLLAYLATYPGKKMEFGADLIRAKITVPNKDFNWLHRHHDIDFSDVWPPQGDGLNDVSEMYTVSDKGLQKLQMDLDIAFHGSVESNIELIADSLRQSARNRMKARRTL